MFITYRILLLYVFLLCCTKDAEWNWLRSNTLVALKKKGKIRVSDRGLRKTEKIKKRKKKIWTRRWSPPKIPRLQTGRIWLKVTNIISGRKIAGRKFAIAIPKERMMTEIKYKYNEQKHWCCCYHSLNVLISSTSKCIWRPGIAYTKCFNFIFATDSFFPLNRHLTHDHSFKFLIDAVWKPTPPFDKNLHQNKITNRHDHKCSYLPEVCSWMVCFLATSIEGARQNYYDVVG